MNNTPHWDGERWRIQVRRDGKRYSFSSNVPGIKGRKECLRKYENWFYSEGNGDKTVMTVCKEFMEDLKARRGEDAPSLAIYDYFIRSYIAPKLGQKKMCKVTLRDWQSLINEATGRNKPLSEKTLKSFKALIQSIIKFGYEDYQCELLRGRLYVPKGRPTQEKEILQTEDIQKLMEPSELWYYPLFIFLLVTGLRPSEGLGLQLGDVYKDHVVIRRGVNSRGKITDLKNANAKRMIPIGALASGILKKTIERNEEYNLNTKWIFCSQHGGQGNQNEMGNQWRKLKAERDLPGTVYSLRHTFISMLKNVLPENTIKDIVGHSKSFDTFGTYGHILRDENSKTASVIDLTFGANFGDNESTSDGQTT
jgi:integrase